MNIVFRQYFFGIAVSLMVFLSGAASAALIKVTSSTPLVLDQISEEWPEQSLIDVGVVAFGTSLDVGSETDAVLPAVRNAEGIYFANQLAKTIEQSGAWGAVRTVASDDVIVDLQLSAIIVQSDGQTLSLEVKAIDTSGKVWLEADYSQVVGKYAYDRRLKRTRDPFQNTYNKIANDILAVRKQMSHGDAEKLRTVSDIRFAQKFSPQAFSEYTAKAKDGTLQLQRLPAQSDALFQRTQQIRERDYLYIDTMQDFYDTFSQKMHRPYQDWRRESYNVVVQIARYDSAGTRRIFTGIAAVIAGAYVGNTGGSRGTRNAGYAGASVGGVLIKSGLNEKNKKAAFIERLAEMGSSLEVELEPRVIELDDRTVTLTGTVEGQYSQWQDLLARMYAAERGEQPVLPVSSQGL